MEHEEEWRAVALDRAWAMGHFEIDINEIKDFWRYGEHRITPLIQAVHMEHNKKSGDEYIKKIKLLLRAGADASIPDENSGATPLHYAAFYGELKVVELLLKTPGGVDALEMKGKMDDASAEGQTPRDLALEKGHSEIVEYIDGKGWMEDDEEWKAAGSLLSCFFPRSKPKSNLSRKAAAAAEKEEDEMWKRTLSKWGINSMEDINEFDEFNGATLLMDAVVGEDIENVKLLLEAGADASVRDRGDRTALHVAAETGNVEITKLILQTPGGPDGLMAYKSWGMLSYTALHDAARAGHAKVVELLLKTPAGVDALEIKALGDQTPRYMALKNGHSEIVEYIDSKGWIEDEEERSAAFAAAAAKKEEEEKSAAVAAAAAEKEEEERRAAAYAARPAAAKEAFTQALAKGLFEKDIDEWNDRGTTALIDAVRDGNNEDAKLLLEAWANPSVRNKNSYYGSTALHDAASKGNVEMAKLMLVTPGGADALEMADDDGYMPLHYAVDNERVETAKLLLGTPGGLRTLGHSTHEGRTPRDILDLRYYSSPASSEIRDYVNSVA